MPLMGVPAGGAPGPPGPQGIPGVSSFGAYSLDSPGSGVVGDGVTDDSAAINAYVATVPDGGLIFASKTYLCKSTIDISGRKGLHFQGVGGWPYVPYGTYGAQFIGGTLNMTLFSCLNSGSIILAGPLFTDLGFFDSVGGATLFNIGDTDRFGFDHCLFAGTQSGTRSKAGIYISTAANDEAYWHFRDCTVISFGDVGSYTAGKGGLVVAAGQGGDIYGGVWQGNWPSIDLVGGVGVLGCRVFGGKYDGGNPAIRDGGGWTSIAGTFFEIANNPGCGYEAVTGASSPSLVGCSFSRGGTNTGSTGWIIDSGIFGAQIINPRYSNLAINFTDNGTDTLMLRGTSSASVAYMKVRGISHFAGSGSPESVVTAPVGSTYCRTDGGAGTSFYVKESGSGNTGWIGK